LAIESVIHVVEDDRSMRDSLVELLEDAGYAVRAYTRAEELLVRDAALERGCIVSDVRMPGIDGLTLLRRLRTNGSILPLILITDHGDVSIAVTAMKAGALDFLESRLMPTLSWRPSMGLCAVAQAKWVRRMPKRRADVC
jgi:two-component system response regulator FixJ